MLVRDEDEDIEWWHFVVLYLAVMLAGVGIGLGAEALLGADWVRVLGLYFGVVFLLASVNRPSLLFRVVRNTGWFAVLPSGVLRVLLCTLGLLLLIGAVTGALECGTGPYCR